MYIPTVSELVKNDNKAEFVCYRDNQLIYKATSVDGYQQFEFPIPIADTGSGVFNREMKAITCMRWIRKHIETMKTWEAERSACLK